MVADEPQNANRTEKHFNFIGYSIDLDTIDLDTEIVVERHHLHR